LVQYLTTCAIGHDGVPISGLLINLPFSTEQPDNEALDCIGRNGDYDQAGKSTDEKCLDVPAMHVLTCDHRIVRTLSHHT